VAGFHGIGGKADLHQIGPFAEDGYLAEQQVPAR
jgi:hypothetical protein